MLGIAVARAKKPEQPRHRLLVEILRLTPLYRDISGLCEWEDAFQNALGKEDDESEVGQILWNVFDFGCYNMYAKFDAEGTAQAYESLCLWLSAHGVSVPASHGLADWRRSQPLRRSTLSTASREYRATTQLNLPPALGRVGPPSDHFHRSVFNRLFTASRSNASGSNSPPIHSTMSLYRLSLGFCKTLSIFA